MGGGTVIVPSGNYLCTSILLKDNVNLILECGATIYASRNIDDYKIIPECLELLIPMV